MDEKTWEALAYLKRTIDRYEGYADKAIDVNGRNALAHLQAMAEENEKVKAELGKVEAYAEKADTDLGFKENAKREVERQLEDCWIELKKAEAEVERLKKRLREEFATSVNNAEEMREQKARAEKAEAEVEHRCDQRDAALESCGLLSSELEKVKAENERLSKQHDQCHDRNNELVRERVALKAEVERIGGLEKRLREEFATSVNNAEEMREWKVRAEKAEAEVKELTLQVETARQHTADVVAELEAARPLIEAVEKLEFDAEDIRGGWYEWTIGDDEYLELHKAALAYKEQHER